MDVNKNDFDSDTEKVTVFTHREGNLLGLQPAGQTVPKPVYRLVKST